MSEMTLVEQQYADAMVRRQQQIEEYSQWVAAVPITVGTALAFNTGDPVPASHVERFKWDALGLVSPRLTSESAQAVPAVSPVTSEAILADKDLKDSTAGSKPAPKAKV